LFSASKNKFFKKYVFKVTKAAYWTSVFPVLFTNSNTRLKYSSARCTSLAWKVKVQNGSSIRGSFQSNVYRYPPEDFSQPHRQFLSCLLRQTEIFLAKESEFLLVTSVLTLVPLEVNKVMVGIVISLPAGFNSIPGRDGVQLCFPHHCIQTMVWGSIHGGGEIFLTRPDWLSEPPSLLYSGYRVTFPGVKRPGRGVGHPPHLTPRLKKE